MTSAVMVSPSVRDTLSLLFRYVANDPVLVDRNCWNGNSTPPLPSDAALSMAQNLAVAGMTL